MKCINMSLVLIILASCSPKPKSKVLQLPAYGDMSAAEDAGKAK